MLWRWSLVCLLSVGLAPHPPGVRAQNLSGVALGANSSSYHPDGRVGHIALGIWGDYASARTSGEITATDAQRLRLELEYVGMRRLTALARLNLVRQDSTKYELTGGFRYYLKGPEPVWPANADGQVGGLAVTLAVGARFSSRSIDTTRWVADIGLILPLSARLTVAAGYRCYENIEWSDVSRFSATLVYYFAAYTADSVYVNPDGPVGYPALRLSGFGSEKGFGAGTALLFPMNGRLTLQARAGWERIEKPYQRSLTAGAGFLLYSGD